MSIKQIIMGRKIVTMMKMKELIHFKSHVSISKVKG